MTIDQKLHWEKIYQDKSPKQVSWTQSVPQTSLDLIEHANLPKNAAIIDVGGGESRLVDHLLMLGYNDVSVLDISKNAIERSKQRLGNRANGVQWIEADIRAFKPTRTYALWHDRAVFHFLTNEDDIAHYKQLIYRHLNNTLIMSTFSLSGPLKCSGLPIKQYSAELLQKQFVPHVELLEGIEEKHQTPFGTTQDFICTRFKMKKID